MWVNCAQVTDITNAPGVFSDFRITSDHKVLNISFPISDTFTNSWWAFILPKGSFTYICNWHSYLVSIAFLRFSFHFLINAFAFQERSPSLRRLNSLKSSKLRIAPESFLSFLIPLKLPLHTQVLFIFIVIDFLMLSVIQSQSQSSHNH